MATEQDWDGYTLVDHLGGGDTLLVKTEAGVGARVEARDATLFRNSYGQYDASDQVLTIANGGTYDLPNFSGMVIINHHTTDNIALYLCGAGGVAWIGGAAATASGTLAFASGVNGYRFTNTSGAAFTGTITAIRTRGAA